MSLFPSPVEDMNRKRPRTGIWLALYIFVQEFFHMITLNALFLICSLPIVTVPAASCAMSRVNGFYVQELACDQWKEFFRTFRTEFLRALPVGLLLLLIPAPLVFAAFVLLQKLHSAASYLALTLCLTTATLLVLIRYYFFPLLAWTNLSVKKALHNSFLFAIVRLPKNLVMLAVHAVLFFVTVYYFPMSTPYLALCVFASCNLFSTFLAWGGIRQYVLQQAPAEASSDEMPEVAD